MLTIALAVPFGATTQAIPVSTPPPPGPRVTPSDTPPPGSTAANVLPFDTSVMLVLDAALSSATLSRNQVVKAHLRDDIKVGNQTIASAGSPVLIDIVGAQGAKSEDNYGYVDIALEPLQLKDGSLLPLRAPTSHITDYVSAGHQATVGVEDTIGDIFIPGHIIYRAIRKGRNVTIAAGSLLRARTIGTVSIDATGAIAVATPRPISMPASAPAGDFKPLPFYTQPPVRHPNARATPYHPTPTPEPTATPTPDASPTATASATAT